MRKLIVIVGSTGVGKTDLSLDLANLIHSPILSVDSRQIFKSLRIGVASPTQKQLEQIKHYFIAYKNLNDYYSASNYEHDAINLLKELFNSKEILLATGGSMMYVDALRYGIDLMPDVDESVRLELQEQYKNHGLVPILEELRVKDPQHYEVVDRKNYKRVIHAVEICRTTGKTYTSFRLQSPKKRPFECITIGLERDRQDLYNRINKRVDRMMQDGLLDEVENLYQYRSANALNTVGYKELFNYLDGNCTLEFAIEKIKQNTRIYAKQQMRWFKKDANIFWINITNKTNDEILNEVLRHINENN